MAIFHAALHKIEQKLRQPALIVVRWSYRVIEKLLQLQGDIPHILAIRIIDPIFRINTAVEIVSSNGPFIPCHKGANKLLIVIVVRKSDPELKLMILERPFADLCSVILLIKCKILYIGQYRRLVPVPCSQALHIFFRPRCAYPSCPQRWRHRRLNNRWNDCRPLDAVFKRIQQRQCGFKIHRKRFLGEGVDIIGNA